ncbi:MAG: hypothetical protein KDG52_04400 [Rhodocyclaceae bacterium]|nr:hypothetical protein [Rhodocyclaceae bacterium]
MKAVDLFAAMVLLGSAVEAAAAGFVLGVGTHAGIGRDQAAAIESRLAEAPADAIRDDLLWSRVERRPGRFERSAEVRELDALIDSSRRQGREVVLILAYGNRAVGVHGLPRSADERAAFLRYVRWAVEQYKDRVRYFEVWNEWNTGMGAGAGKSHGSAAAYLALLKEVYPAIKALAPEAVVLGGAVSGTDTDWVQAFLDAGGPDHLDALSLHPYVHAKGRAGLPERVIGWLDQVRAQLASRPAWRDKPIFITEIGWPSSVSPQGVSASRVADFVVRFLSLARARADWIHGVWWYELIDGGRRPEKNGHNFGLFDRAGGSKPALAAIAKMRALITRFDDWHELDVGPDARLVIASNPSPPASCAVLWSVHGAHPAFLLFAAGGDIQWQPATATDAGPVDGKWQVAARETPQIWCAERGLIEAVPVRPIGRPDA